MKMLSSPELEKLKSKVEKYTSADRLDKLHKLLRAKSKVLRNLELRDDPQNVVTIEQAAKDAAREKIDLNKRKYLGGWDEKNRLCADLLELCNGLVAMSVLI